MAFSSDVLGQADGSEDGRDSTVFDVGYSDKVLYDVDVSDALAATKVWVRILLRRAGVDIESGTTIYHDMPSVARALREKRLDLIVLLPTEYLELKELAAVEPIASAVLRGDLAHDYLLLVHKEGRPVELGDLRGKTLLVETAGKGGLPWMWVETLLHGKGLPPARMFFAEIREVRKVSQGVLPVFFRQADACIVPLDAFKTMVELNPQLGEQLESLASSPPVCRGLVCARMDLWETRFREVLSESMLSLRTDPEGQQLLTLFHVDQLIRFDPAHLRGVIDLLKAYEKVIAEQDGGKPNVAVGSKRPEAREKANRRD